MIEEELKEKLGERLFKRAKLIAENRFGYKTHFIDKYYKSILDGYLDINEEWSNETIIELIKNKVDRSENKLKLIQEIIETYDIKDPKTNHILDKYLRALKNNKI